MDKLDGKALKAYSTEVFPKFLATVDKDGTPNIVPVLTIKAADPQTLVFARMMVWKTAQNLEATGLAASCCYGPGGSYYRVRIKFEGFVKSGPHIDGFNKAAIFRYNAYAGASEVGVFKIQEVLEPRNMNWAKRILEMRSVHKAAKALAATNGGQMPPVVVEHFDRRASVKYIAHIDADGWPAPQPVFSLFPAGDKTLVFKSEDDLLPPPGTVMAASAITHQLTAYQVKGKYRGREMIAGTVADILDVDYVFSASPPLPGKRVFPPEY